MPDKFQNKYRIPSARLQNWDYGSNAAYFVTICTKDRECFFGEIVDSEMQLSEIGKIAETEWLKTPGIRPDMNLELGEYVVMPNHFHGIIIIGENEFNTQRGGDGNDRRDAMHGVSVPTNDSNRKGDAMHYVSEPTNDSNRKGDAMHCVSTETANTFAPQSKNLASIIRGYKSAVKKHATLNNINFAWQSRFHDHIIRDNQSFHNISEYIINNPLNWSVDQLYM